MAQEIISVQKLLQLSQSLTPTDKLKLIQKLSAELEPVLAQSASRPKRSLKGIFQGYTITDADIDQSRKELWSNFPREDL